MASRFNITLPNGTRFTLLYNEEQSKRSLQEDLILKPWTGYCHENWLSVNHGQAYAPEHKVKRLLDRCGTLLLRDVALDDRDTLTIYKEGILKSREINMSDCPASVLQLLETGKLETASLNRDEHRELLEFLNGSEDEAENRPKKVKRRETRFERINALMRRYPDGKLSTVRVDTENRFCYKDSWFEIAPSVKGYAPRHTRYGDQYDMDRIMVIDCGIDQLHFADQDGYGIEDKMIQPLEGEI